MFGFLVNELLGCYHDNPLLPIFIHPSKQSTCRGDCDGRKFLVVHNGTCYCTDEPAIFGESLQRTEDCNDIMNHAIYGTGEYSFHLMSLILSVLSHSIRKIEVGFLHEKHV